MRLGLGLKLGSGLGFGYLRLVQILQPLRRLAHHLGDIGEI